MVYNTVQFQMRRPVDSFYILHVELQTQPEANNEMLVNGISEYDLCKIYWYQYQFTGAPLLWDAEHFVYE